MGTNIKLSSVAASVPYDNSTTLLTAGSVQAALDQLFVLIGTSAVSFSYKLILSTETITIPINREMVVNNYIEIDGILIIEGDLSIV